MILCRLSILALIALPIAGKWGDLPHADTHALQGPWEIVSVERGGVPDPTVAGYTLTFERGEVHFQVPLVGPTKYSWYLLPEIDEQKIDMARS